MICKGRSRADAGQLVAYLTKQGDNDGIPSVLEMRGMAGRDLRAGLRMAEVEAEQTRGTKPLYHAQIAPAEGEHLTREQTLEAVAILERHLGFQDLPRVVIVHEKEGREHIHVAWCRFDRDIGTLRRDDFTKRKNVAASAEMAQRFGLDQVRNPFDDEADQTLSREEKRARSRAADTHAEQQQTHRAAKSREDRKAEITELWASTDSGKAFRAALDDAGYTLGHGWRGLVVVDANGETHSLARQIEGARAKDVRARMADLDLATITAAKEIKAAVRQARQDRAREIAYDGADRLAPSTPDQEQVAPQRPETMDLGGAKVAAPPPEAAQRPFYEAGSRQPGPKQAAAGSDEENHAPDPLDAAGVLAALTQNHSTFTRQDLARIVDKNTGGGGREAWMQQTGGLDALDDDRKASAERSYAAWTKANPETAARHGLADYVSYVQARHANREEPGGRQVRQDSKAAFDRLLAEVEASADLIRLGPDHGGRERFTSRDMLETELRMQDAAGDLALRQGRAIRDHIRSAAPSLATLNEGQRQAFDHITGAGDLALVVGYAGTGKSRMLGSAREAWEAEGYRVRGAALSGIAAESLQNDSGIRSRTLHSLLHQLDTLEQREASVATLDSQLAGITGTSRKAAQYRADLKAKRDDMAADLDAVRLTDRDVIVIDEAAMVGSRQMGKLLAEAEKAHAKVVLVGDAEQLQAVDAGAAFRAIRDQHGAAEITEVRRQAEDWQRKATREFAQAQTAEALERYSAAGMTHQANTRDQAKAELVTSWTAAREARPEASQIILAYTRADVAELNDLARAAYRAEGKLGQDHALKTAAGVQDFAAGDRLYFTKNDTRLAVKNGSLGTIDGIEGGRVSVTLDGGRAVAFDLADYAHIAHGYAATVHKSQGVTVDRAHVLASRYMDRHAAYVGMTRHRERADLYFGADEFKDWDQLTRRMGRDGSKDTTLDYLTRAGTDGTSSESLRAAVDSYLQQERPHTPRPAWTRPAMTPAGRDLWGMEAAGHSPEAAQRPSYEPASPVSPVIPAETPSRPAQRMGYGLQIQWSYAGPAYQVNTPQPDTTSPAPPGPASLTPQTPRETVLQVQLPVPERIQERLDRMTPEKRSRIVQAKAPQPVQQPMPESAPAANKVEQKPIVPDRIQEHLARMSPEKRAKMEELRQQREKAEELRQNLKLEHDFGGPSM